MLKQYLLTIFRWNTLIDSFMDLNNVHVSELYRKIGSMCVLFSKKPHRLLASYRKNIFSFDIFLGVEKSPEKLTLFPLMILSADVIFSFIFAHFQSFFTKDFFRIMFVSANIVVVIGKLAKIIDILHFDVEMLVVHNYAW